MSPDRAARLIGAVISAFGDQFTFTARKASADVNLPRVEDTSRLTFTANGVWSGPAKERHPQARGRASDHAQSVVATAPAAKFPVASLLWMPVEGDLCVRVDTAERWAVGRIVTAGYGEVVVTFTAKST